MTELTLHTIKPAHGSRKKAFAIGRGEGTGLGKTSGRGTKGQRARSGGKRGLAHLGMKRVLLRIPKVRGFKSHGSRLQTITLDDLERWFPAGAKVTVEGLKSASRIPARAGGAKVVQTGTLTKALTLVDIATTPGAKIVIEKLGGTIGEIRKSKKGKKATASKKAVR
jgi:large subunit ribosomal protein L15